MQWTLNGVQSVANDFLLTNISRFNLKITMVHKMKSNKSSTKWNTYFKDCKEWENGYNKPPHVTVQNYIGKFLHKR